MCLSIPRRKPRRLSERAVISLRIRYIQVIGWGGNRCTEEPSPFSHFFCLSKRTRGSNQLPVAGSPSVVSRSRRPESSSLDTCPPPVLSFPRQQSASNLSQRLGIPKALARLVAATGARKKLPGLRPAPCPSLLKVCGGKASGSVCGCRRSCRSVPLLAAAAAVWSGQPAPGHSRCWRRSASTAARAPTARPCSGLDQAAEAGAPAPSSPP